MTHKPQIVRDPEIQGGTPVYSGTRVPVAIMLDYLADGQPLDNFLEQYPSVSRKMALQALEEVKGLLVTT